MSAPTNSRSAGRGRTCRPGFFRTQLWRDLRRVFWMLLPLVVHVAALRFGDGLFAWHQLDPGYGPHGVIR